MQQCLITQMKIKPVGFLHSVSILVNNFKFSVWSSLKPHWCGSFVVQIYLNVDALGEHAWLLSFNKFWKKTPESKRTQGEFVEVKPSIQHIFDGRLPASALLDLKAPLSARAGIKKHFHTSHSNQSLLFLTTVKAFMLTRHCDQSFIHTFKRDWPVNELVWGVCVCVYPHQTIHHICVDTLSRCVSSYRWYFVWLPLTVHELSVISTLRSLQLCVSVHGPRQGTWDAHIFPSRLRFSAQM